MLAEDEEGVLATAVEGAGLAIEIARLQVELRGQLDEVDASRARIVAAADEERRRSSATSTTAPSSGWSRSA